MNIRKLWIVPVYVTNLPSSTLGNSFELERFSNFQQGQRDGDNMSLDEISLDSGLVNKGRAMCWRA